MFPPTVRFGKYDYATLQRRQQYQSNLELKGQSATDIVDTIFNQGNYRLQQYDPTQKLIGLLEKAVSKCNREQLKALDTKLSDVNAIIPDALAQAIERRTLTLHRQALEQQGPHSLMAGNDPLSKVKADLALLDNGMQK